MPIFLTGATGYIGAHVASELLATYNRQLILLVRADNAEHAARRLWKSMQLHLDFAAFSELLNSRMRVCLGDLTASNFGLDEDAYRSLVHDTDSIVHCAASLNRKSEKACLNVNLRGTLEMMKLATAAQEHHGLRRYSHVSTVAVAGQRSNEVVREDESIDWGLSDYDPYARTKKFCEHMVHELLPDVQRTIFRPSIVLGDSRRPETTQFDMVRAFVFLASLPVLPFRPKDRLDIVPVEYVAESVARLHLKDRPDHDTYHLSSGTGAQTFREVAAAVTAARGRRGPVFAPSLQRPFATMVNALALPRRTRLSRIATLLKVFLPYLYWNTVFDNQRVVAEMGYPPARFSEYCYPLLRFSRENHFQYRYQDWPLVAEGAAP